MFLPRGQDMSADLEEWCNEANARAMNRGISFWYVVKRKRNASGQMEPFIDRLDGLRAEEMQDRWRGKSKPVFRPSREEIEAIHHSVGQLVSEGCTPMEFTEMVNRGWLNQRVAKRHVPPQRFDDDDDNTPF